ncbi:MAG: DedA family protein [Ignavibacteriaceae bacterium]|jgi:membrane protein DedA with SNARE-associated domain|nr:DedA family protein [Ignavibacteriaceae bacterium]MCW8812115.1 DedA family protein [Chlorobium sp.]MCW8817540.1 DedA family protein [Ignavibacteriaceae bacterium]MCW8960442.1 DedA family protein [Ignavibacteriaceae bacterium]MCW8996783.1 DedA family protein [Psychromonas sp.]
MFEDILNQISTFPPLWIYVTLFFFAFIENVFPPSPSDLVVLIGGSLISTGVIHFIPTLILTTIGSLIGFMVLFYIGSAIDKKVIHSGKLKFIPIEAVDKVEAWFNKYGYWVILANRFLPGTRSVISFFSGLSHLKVEKTILLATISAFAWNAIILFFGITFGDHVKVIDNYISTYSNIVIAVTVVIVLFFIIRNIIQKKKQKAA